jgi:hypothetical protein
MIIVIFFGVFFGLLLIGLCLVIYSSYKGKGRWGINPKLIVCPRCGATAPPIRKPTSLRQALWGGWTCNKCGCEIDKWGKAIENRDSAYFFLSL